MISDQRFRHLEKLIADADEAGANVEVGGRQWHNAYLPGGAYFDGTVVGDATPEMEISQTERRSMDTICSMEKSLIHSLSIRSRCTSDEVSGHR